MFIKALLYNKLTRVIIGSIDHLVPIIIAILFSVFTIYYAKNKLAKEFQIKLFNFLGCFISLSLIAYHIHYAINFDYDLSKDLPLFLCSFLALIIPFFTFFRKYWLFEILVFWIIAGTLQGVITPDIAEGFPSLDYFRYWIVHLGLLMIIFYAIFVFKMRPKFISVFKSIIVLQIYLIVMFCTNKILGANYTYLNAKPEAASLLDYFGEWPYYILVVQVLLIPYFLLIYLPFYLTRKN